MWSTIWHAFFFDPIYNSLVFFIDVIPGGDVGLAIILTTILVKTLLLPLSVKAVKTQVVMREIEPELKAIKEQFKDQREEQAKAMLELYRKVGINPFASIFLVFLQIPIVIALYLAVSKGGGTPLPEINTTLLYSFVPVPVVTSMVFLGVIDITLRSLPLAALAGISQFIQAKLSITAPAPREKDAPSSFKDDLTRSMHVQMRYVLPVIIFFVAYSISAAIALYFTISSLTAIVQEFIVRRHKKTTN